MIRIEAIRTASDLAYALRDKGFMLAPKAGTPLKMLYDWSTRSPVSTVEVQDSSVCDRTLEIANSTDGKQTGHDIAEQETVELVYRTCSNAIAFSRTVVNPVIAKIHEAVATAANNVDVTLRYAVAPFYYDELLEQVGFTAMLSKHSEVALAPLRVDVKAFPEIDDGKLRELVKTGSGTIDNRVETLLAELPADTLGKVYNAVFTGKRDFAVEMGLFLSVAAGVTFAPARTNIHYVALAYLLARGLSNAEIPEGVKLSADEYEAQVASVIAQAGRRLSNGLDMRKEDLRTGLLVFKFPHGQPFALDSNDTAIVVNGDVYDKFLKAGGTPEILIGNAQEARKSFMEEIVAGAEHSLRVYRKYEAQVVEQHDATFVSRVKAALSREILEAVKATPDEELSRQRTDCVVELREHLRMVQRAELDCLWSLIRRLVCHVLYPHSDALKILSTFDEIAQRQPEASVETVEYHVLLSYTLDYLVECVDVRDIA